ncbi:MAG: hypothetical protein A3I61_08425 [Acidobacteria bacterium RIFCSPLOWO2_02_FULL_68_18]|nr:MAG: hypothetical protein A3I61_08425 [Acidobacteria bacterium RIFCSPLOWO2_02_FULL_68_18]OFW48875.1 MAG: hypothetical protein A3G77_01545 [Acidobacteria bacterium RIFCSPLOWO2_12_FULL_68_19]
MLVAAPSLSLAGQATGWRPPRTPDGQPDLQGFWTNATYTPLERPKDVTKAFYTKEEAAELEKRLAAADAAQTEPGTIEDVHYDFTQFGLDTHQAPYASNQRTSMIVDPPDGRLPPMSEPGRRRAAERAEQEKRVGRWDSAQTNQLDDRCMIFAGAGPPMLPQSYNSNYQIVQASGYVMILFEMAHDVRIIPLDGRPHLPPEIRQWIGDSRGRWEGDTLVVETTNLNGRNPLNGSSEHMRVTERFTRVDADTIRYQFTIEDPSTWTRPWSAELPMRKATGPLFEHACHEGNYGLYNTLAGARLAEKKAAEEAARKGSK